MADNGISLLNPGLGISGVTAPRTEAFTISGRGGRVCPALSVSGNEKGLEIYDGINIDSIVDAYLTPESEDPDLMSPHIFETTLASALDKLAAAGNDSTLAGMNAEIRENNSILRMFSSLVIAG